jgi:fructose-1,6-bisphosphatase/inositol monophosphatase family enzyme
MDDMFALARIVKGVGEKILGAKSSGLLIEDTVEYKGHDSSSIDTFARQEMQALIDRHLSKRGGIVRFELDPYSRTFIEQPSPGGCCFLTIDEIEGTTNTKRCLASPLSYRPHAAVTMAIGTGPRLADIYASAIYTLDQGETYMAQRTTEGFNTYRDRELINPAEVVLTLGDSKRRILVIGYSNSYRIKKAAVEQVLYDAGFKVYDGCRASTVDIINLMRNSYDAYIDLRSIWSTMRDGQEAEAMLQTYDIAAVIPCAVGCRLCVTDAEGNPWQNYGQEDTIPLVVSRPDIHDKILELIAPNVTEWKSEQMS